MHSVNEDLLLSWFILIVISSSAFCLISTFWSLCLGQPVGHALRKRSAWLSAFVAVLCALFCVCVVPGLGCGIRLVRFLIIPLLSTVELLFVVHKTMC